LIDLEAAKLSKQQTIALAEGQAEAKKMILAADGALQLKADTYVKTQEVWANAFKERKVPSVVMGAREGSGSDNDVNTFMNMLNIKAAKDLALDLSINTPSHK